MIVSDTGAFHQKIEEMGQRIRQLEDALAIFQTTVSPERHPLLRDEHLKIKFPLEAPGQEDSSVKTEGSPKAVDLADALGTLTLGEGGHMRYLGRSAGSESLLELVAYLLMLPILLELTQTTLTQGEDQQPADNEVFYSFVHQDIAQLANSFPFKEGTWDIPQSLNLILTYLPNKQSAWYICETYLVQGLWSTDFVSREELFDEILAPLYAYIESFNSSQSPPPIEDEDSLPISPHRLAVLFFVLAIGAQVDLASPPFSVDAENYFVLGKACLSLRSVFSSKELETVQALALASIFLNHGGPRNSLETAWTMLGLCVKLVHRVSIRSMFYINMLLTGRLPPPPLQLGLHSESPKWRLDAKTIHRRRSIFWEVYTIDILYSLNLGRPTSLNMAFVDCPFPDQQELTGIEAERDQCMRWGWKFIKEVATNASASTLTPKFPDYELILELDKKLREQGFPPDAEWTNSPYLHTRGMMLSAITLMHIHRSFFVKAVLDFPHDPLSSPYSLSFLAAFRAATTLIQLHVRWFSKHQDLMVRCWGSFNSLLSAGVIVGSVVTRSPTCSIAHTAFVLLGSTVEIFSGIIDSSTRARAAHDILKKLQDKATKIFSETQGQGQGQGQQETGETLDDELEIFGGYTKVRTSPAPRRDRDRDRTRASASASPPAETPSPSLAYREVSQTYGGDPFALSMFSTMGPAPEPPQLQPQPDYQNSLQVHPQQQQQVPEPGYEYDMGMDWDVPRSSMAGDSGMDAQWFSFMQNEGILDGYGNLNTAMS
ncbi:hypothetical protein V5O48_002834 [Marasmius crinis-equi]|uniref:Xylanolytic transcriptional activator regulatory domain-containing protein n=1 Tax=Marasmius crinis-equi TaxID=585013 RepID=A0ABR3FUH5_9AGAR